MPTLTRLIKKIASNPSTEELILFIANNDEMVGECVGLQKRLETSNSRELDDLDGLCRNHHISLEMFSREVHNILAIFAPASVSNEYAILGLKANADQKRVKDAFRRLSIKYHPDSSGNGDSDKFIEICQAYKTIISRSGSDKPTSHAGRTTSWRYTKKRGLSSRQKRRNIYLISTLTVVLLIISIITPYMYQKKIMLLNLNSADPVLISRQEISKVAPAEEKIIPIKLTAESDTRTEKPALQDDVFEINTADPDTAKIPPPPINLQPTSDTPEPKKQPTVSSSPEPIILTLLPTSKEQPPPEVITKTEPRKQPSVTRSQEPEVIILDPAAKKQKPSAAITKTETQKQPPIIRIHESEIRAPKLISYAHEPSSDFNKFDSVNQPSTYGSQNLETQKINDFIHAYTKAYESKKLQQFSRFFATNALENSHSFSEQHVKYIMLFQSVDTIDLDIDILSSNMKDENVQLKGRFQINLTYPQRQPVQKKGQIFFLLTDNNQQYMVKELSYTFDPTE